MLQSTIVNLKIQPTLVTDFGNLSPSLPASLTFGAGTSALQADLLYIKTRSVTSGTPDTMDLNGGGLLQPDATAFNVVEVAIIILFNKDAAATLTLGGGSNAVPNIAGTILPGGYAVILAPGNPAYPVTAGTGDILQVTASAGTVLYDIMIIARSA